MKLLIKALLVIAFIFSFCNSFGQPPSTPRFRKEFLEEINNIRQQGCTCGTTYMPPVAPLVWNDELEDAAMGHAKDMANLNYFSHTSKDGRTMNSRISAAGYGFKGFRSYAIGENIAEGQQSIDEVIKGWFKSPGHCMNLMNAGFKEIGVAEYEDYWVQDFGGREPFTAAQQKLMKTGKYKLIEKN